MRHTLSICAVSVGLALAACASLPPGTPGVPAQLPVGGNFDLAGRLAVRYEDKGFSGSLRWQHRDTGDVLALGSPLGQTVAQLTSDGSGAQLITSDQKRYSAVNVETLVRQALGWELPLTGLSHWALGNPVPGDAITVQERDAQGRLVRFVQNAWQVQISSYAAPERGGGPARMQLDYGNNLEIRLVIDDLKTEPAALMQ